MPTLAATAGFVMSAAGVALHMRRKFFQCGPWPKMPPPVIEFPTVCFHSPTASDDVDGLPARHTLWTAVLKRFVSPGVVNGCAVNLVDLAALAEDDSVFRRYLVQCEAPFEGTPNERLAFLLNAYNALVLKIVLDRFVAHLVSC